MAVGVPVGVDVSAGDAVAVPVDSVVSVAVGKVALGVVEAPCGDDTG
jgi:hypothetical protein